MGGKNVCQLWREIPCEKRFLSCMAFSIYKDVRITYQLRYLSGRKYLAIWNLSVSPTHGWSKSLMSVKSDLRYRVSRGFSLSWPLVFTKPFSSLDSCLWRHKQTNHVAYKQCKRYTRDADTLLIIITFVQLCPLNFKDALNFPVWRSSVIMARPVFYF